MKMVAKRVVKASDIAKLLAKPPEGTEEEKIFGKVFEECYTFATFLHEENFYFHRPTNKTFARKVASELKAHGIYSKELIRRAYRMYSALLRAGVVGRKPKTKFRTHNDILIAAQPDLYDGTNYYEFKTYPIDDYARAQSKVFSFVLSEPIILVGLVVREDGYVDFEKEVVTAENFVLPEIPPTLGIYEDVCDECGFPLKYCICGAVEFEEEAEEED
jgi:NAD-dependent dihydropyrimidine dehydrogenase PreA subunit